MLLQRKEAESLRVAGSLTVTDVEDTRAREMSTKSSELEAKYALELRTRDMRRMFGEVDLAGVLPLSKYALSPVEPAKLDYWLERARTASPKVASAKVALEIAKLAANATKGEHVPTADLVASVTHTANPNSFTTLERSGGVSVRVNVPLYEGWRTSASVRKAEAQREQAGAGVGKSNPGRAGQSGRSVSRGGEFD